MPRSGLCPGHAPRTKGEKYIRHHLLELAKANQAAADLTGLASAGAHLGHRITR